MQNAYRKFNFNITRSSVILIAIIITSFCLNFFGNNFPLTLHPDEFKKISYIRGDEKTNFKHPQLILKFGRISSNISSASSIQDIAQAGRTSTALLGSTVVFFTFLLARQFLSEPSSLLAASLTTVSPGIVIHSHYLKEDIALTCFTTASLVFAIFISKESNSESSFRSKSKMKTFIWGVFTGLAFSSKYTAFLLLPFYFFLPWLIKGLPRKTFHKKLFISLVTAGIIFLFINNQLFLEYKTFIYGAKYELNHALTGHHGIKIYPWNNLVHLSKNLPDSLGFFTMILGLLGISRLILRLDRLDKSLKIILYFTIYIYLVLECLPLKPPPGDVRYVIPLIPPFTCFAAFSISELNKWLKCRINYIFITGIILSIATIIPPLVRSIEISNYMNNDIRTRIPNIIVKYPKPIVFDDPKIYTGFQFLDDSVKEEISRSTGVFDKNAPLIRQIFDKTDQDVCTFVTSDFIYDRYLTASEYSGQEKDIYERGSLYRRLFENKFEEINPQEPSYSFVNPTLRIVDFCQTNPE